jgi:LCP family protein required for cell wall assembly
VDFIADLIEEVFAIPIKDYVYVKTKGFREIVDAFGGVKVYVPVRMYYIDPTQDLYIDIEKGTRTLHGKDAEGYVRFRQGYDENGAFHNYGDLFRKQNQNRFIQAFIQQHVTLKNLGKLPTLMDIFKRNVITSVTELGQFTDYAAMAEQAINEGYTIESVELQLTEKTIDGSSYVVIKTDKE